ncbi:PQQ-binding-like beta-propeller repeat protein [Gordonia amarae]|nr:PQQ-binding-like beta-propeller repeat protein [Gordonia amarae]
MSRTLLWALLSGVALLVVAVVVVVTTVVDKDDQSGNTWLSGDGDSDYRGYDLSEPPQQVWRVSAAEAHVGMWLDPKTKWGAQEPTGYIEDGGIVIAAGAATVGDDGRKTVGINARDGAIRWQADTQGHGCSPLLTNHRIACAHIGDVDVLDTRTGKKNASFAQPDDGYDSTVSLGSTLVSVSRPDAVMAVHLGDEPGPGSRRIVGPIIDGNTGWTSNGTVGTYCSSSVRATSSIVFDSKGGQPRPASSTGCFSALPGGGFVESNAIEAVVYTDSGEMRFASPHPMTFPRTFGTSAERQIAIIPTTGGVVDLAARKEIWFSPVLLTDPLTTQQVVGIVGDVVVVLTDDGASLVGLSLHDGKQLWHIGGLRSYGSFSSPMSDGRRLVFRHSKEGLVCVDTSTGTRLWTLPDAEQDTSSKSFLSGGRMVTVNGAAIAGYGWR